MPYSELIKNFERIRRYIKEFYIYGFKHRNEYEQKSVRSYDNERRRIESYLGNYIGFHQDKNGKNIFISIDSRRSHQNPLYKAWKAKSFTDGDITLHFIIFDILYKPDVVLTLGEICEKTHSDYLSEFDNPMQFDDSTIRKKLKEYVTLGLLTSKKIGKQILYSRNEGCNLSMFEDVLGFFSEVSPCGVIGSFLLDKNNSQSKVFSFKHHYITNTPDSEIMCSLFEAIHEKRSAAFSYYVRKRRLEDKVKIVPLKIYMSVQDGRSYIFGWNIQSRCIGTFRLDYISKIQIGEKSEMFGELQSKFSRIQTHLWGVSSKNIQKTEHVEFTVYIANDEEYIYKRLIREKRCGTVERLNKNTCRFTADVYDTEELIPWIRTYICRIVSMDFSNRTVENRFKCEVEEMYKMYGIGGEPD